jgi:hypothetical protein
MKSFIAALRSLVLPFGATSGPRIILDGVNGQISVNTAGPTRIVLGANTPPELISFGVSVAVLFYVTDSVTGVEVGYFFIGLSNVLDAGADNLVLLNGRVLYPIPGDPTSPTHSDVKTNFQINMADPLSTNPSGTYFKDFSVFVQSTVPEFRFSNALTSFLGNLNVATGSTLNMAVGSTLITSRARAVIFVSGTFTSGVRANTTFGTTQVLSPAGSGVTIVGNTLVVSRAMEVMLGLSFRYQSQVAPVNGIRLGNIFINGVDYMQFNGPTTAYGSTNIVANGQIPAFLNPGDVITFPAFHNAGVNLNLIGNSCVWLDENLA